MLLDSLLNQLADQDGSDLHIKAGSPPRMRVDGVLFIVEGAEKLLPPDTVEMAETIMKPEVAVQFMERHEADFAYAVPGLGRFRVNVFQQRGSVAMVFRRVRTTVPTVAELGLPDVVSTLAKEHRGLVLVTGPTGSGKTTTLASMVDQINATRACHIVTIEDPVEVLHQDKLAAVNQREIGLDTMNFAAAMRGAMRQDPDVILVGEMRDRETVEAALSAAETGHLVLSTLHTIDATETVNRIVDYFPPYQQPQIRVMLAGSLKGVLCQRLVQRSDGHGRVAVVEVMVVNGRIQQCILDPQKTGEIATIVADGDYYGMQTFDQAIASLYALGHIDLRGALAAATSPHDLKVILQQRGLVAAGVS
jgi:twitching motility protein PilT